MTLIEKEELKKEFRAFLNKDVDLNEVTKKTSNVVWKSGFGQGTSKFKVQDEDYEIEFDNIDTDGYLVRGVKFYRFINNQRITTYTESKEPLTVMLTMKSEVQKYIEKIKPDIFGFMGKLSETPRLRHYERLLNQLAGLYPIYKLAFMEDKGGERIFVLVNTDRVGETVNGKILTKLREKL